MFRYTATFLVLFLVVNHDFAAARSAEFLAPKRLDVEKRDAFENEPNELKAVKETRIGQAKSRTKRGWASAGAKGLGFLAGTGFALSTASTIYHAIQKCNDYRPDDCRSVNCGWLENCPSICHGPDTNRGYIDRERDVIMAKLERMDKKQQDAFNLATKAITASLNNKRILDEIDSINFKVVRLADKYAQAFDFNYATLLRNNSVAIGTMIRNEKLSLDKIVASQEVDGIFDKWSWEGTFPFVIGTAIPLGQLGYRYIKKQLAVRSIYKNLKLDVVNKRLALASVNPTATNRIVRQGGLSTQVKSQLKVQAKINYQTQQAQKQVEAKESTASKLVGPAINLLVIGLTAWSTYQQISNCKKIADDMQDTAYDMATTADRIEMVKQTLVDPLYLNVTTKSWPSVRGLMTNETTKDYLEQILNLTLGADTPNMTIVNTINRFNDNSASASYNYFIKLQEELIDSLDNVLYKYTCLSNKQNAITTVVTECKRGFELFPALYAYATDKHLLNDGECIKNKMYPYTTQAQFFDILKAAADHQGWYTNCLLNNNDLLYRVCAEKIKGYTTAKDIVAQFVNTTYKGKLTEDMVPNFLGRCPPPKITPAAIQKTCEQYCLYQPIDKISKTAVLLDWQVESIIKTKCGICEVKANKVDKICYDHYCKGQNASTIEKDVEKPLPTVNFVIANNCSNTCTLETAIKESICNDYKCNGKTVADIAKDKQLIEKAVTDVTKTCDTIIPLCPVTDLKRLQACGYYCLYQPVSTIAENVFLTESQINTIIPSCLVPCYLSSKNKEDICYQHYCQGLAAAVIEKDVQKPLSTVSYTIANTCSKKCVIEDADVKKAICTDYKCNKLTVAQIAISQKLTQQAIQDVTPECDTLVPVCSISREVKTKVLDMYCKFGVPKAFIPSYTGIAEAIVNKVIEEHAKTAADCDNYKTNGLP